MPKYILIGIGITLTIFVAMHLWSKISSKTKNKIIASIFGIIALGFVIIISLILF